MSDSCSLSIVVVPLIGGTALHRNLQSLLPYHDDCVVVFGRNRGDAEIWQMRFPSVRFIVCEEHSVPMRRRKGIEASQGEVIALLEDNSVPDPAWYGGLCSAFQNHRVAAAGGPVRISQALKSRFQALACVEYWRFNPDDFQRLAVAPSGDNGILPVSHLPGNNFAYRREALLQVLKETDIGIIEHKINGRLQKRGFLTVLSTGMSVTYSAEDRYNSQLHVRMQHGRLFAGQRVERFGWGTRSFWFMMSLFLPALLISRAIRGMVRMVKPSVWLKVLFWICLMEGAWAVGESIGYIAGSGRSLDVWR